MKPKVVELNSWSEITSAFDSFPPPRLSFGPEGDMDQTTWIFRGHKSILYELVPRIERESGGRNCDWAALESMLFGEFQSKARMYLSARDIPEDKLSWLALMQHYGIPTRLLDFSYSPYIALYFALRERSENERHVVPQSGPLTPWRSHLRQSGFSRMPNAKRRSTKREQAASLGRDDRLTSYSV